MNKINNFVFALIAVLLVQFVAHAQDPGDIGDPGDLNPTDTPAPIDT